MPGCGKTGGPTVPDSEKAEIIPLAMRALELETVIFFLKEKGREYYDWKPLLLNFCCLLR